MLSSRRGLTGSMTLPRALRPTICQMQATTRTMFWRLAAISSILIRQAQWTMLAALDTQNTELSWLRVEQQMQARFNQMMTPLLSPQTLTPLLKMSGRRSTRAPRSLRQTLSATMLVTRLRPTPSSSSFTAVAVWITISIATSISERQAKMVTPDLTLTPRPSSAFGRLEQQSVKSTSTHWQARLEASSSLFSLSLRACLLLALSETRDLH